MSQIVWLDPASDTFPSVEEALTEPNGLLAAGGDLSARRLLNAYRRGIFPWYEDGQPLLWWSPDPRCVLFTETFEPSRSLRRRLRRGDFQVCADKDFAAVIDACSGPRATERGTWITPPMRDAYIELHRQGYAHSVEAYLSDELVGGLYGVSIGRMFYGESMFHQVPDASKVALAWLCRAMAAQGGSVIDCQVETDHLLSMGAATIPRQDFVALVQQLAAPSVDPFQWDQMFVDLGPW